jgi:hypothetical protein
LSLRFRLSLRQLFSSLHRFLDLAVEMETPKSIRSPEREERWLGLRSSGDLHADICTHVASGGAIESLAELWDIPGGWVMQYMTGTDEHAKAFKLAVQARDAWLGESLTRQAVALSTSDIRGILDEQGVPLPKSQWPPELSKAIQSFDVSIDKDGNPTYKIKLYDKLKAIELAGRRVGTFQPALDVKLSGSIDLASIVKESLGDTRSRDDSAMETKS